MKNKFKELIALMFLIVGVLLFISILIYSIINPDKTRMRVFIDTWHLWCLSISFLFVSVNMLKK